MALAYSMLIGSLVYVWNEYKDVWVFLQIVGLPAIYYVGYEILMDKEKEGMNRERGLLKHIISVLIEKVKCENKLKTKRKTI